MRGKIRSVGLTDVGRVREHNEDTIGVDADIGLFVLADGMGGYNAGEVASGIAVKTVMSLVKEAVEHQDMSSADPETGMARPSIVLRDAIARALSKSADDRFAHCGELASALRACAGPADAPQAAEPKHEWLIP